MGKKKSAVLRPSSDPLGAEALERSLEKSRAESLRPEAAGGEVNLAGSDLTAVGREYIDFLADKARLEDELEQLKKKMAHREAWMIEKMRVDKVDGIKATGSKSGLKKTLYLGDDWIVSKAKGVSTEQLADVLTEINIPELIGVAVNANTLKATVKMQMATAGIAGEAGAGEKAYCQKCSTFHPATMVGSSCLDCFDGEHTAPVLIKTIDGIPAALRQILYVEKQYKLGARAS